MVAIPFLMLPRTFLEKFTSLRATNSSFFRLYGIAVTALLVGYAFGIPVAESGRFPWGVVCMGTVSNAGAAVILMVFADRSNQNRALACFFGLIAMALVAAMILPHSAIQKAW